MGITIIRMGRTFKETDEFTKIVSKLDRHDLERVHKLVQKIIANPAIGKPMRYDRRGTREVYFKPFRISYKYDQHTDFLTFLDLYHKRVQ